MSQQKQLSLLESENVKHQNLKVSESFKTGKCQNMKMSESFKTGKYHNLNLPDR